MDELRFKIDAFRPETIPMARLAEYMAALAALLGNEKSIHFVRLDPGSVELVHRVDTEDRPKVEDRLQALRLGDGTDDAAKAYRRLDDMLANDNAVGELVEGHHAIIIAFPGKTRPKPVEYGAFNQQGSLDGVPIKIGGLAETVPIHLQDIGPRPIMHLCSATRNMARAIAAHLFENPIRVHGNGRWKREANGDWTMSRFVIADFEVLDDSPLETVVARLRGIAGNDWKNIEHPLATLRDIRGDEENIDPW